jgi:hypothetical protein
MYFCDLSFVVACRRTDDLSTMIFLVLYLHNPPSFYAYIFRLDFTDGSGEPLSHLAFQPYIKGSER